MPSILTKQVLVRISEEEAEEWQKIADAMGGQKAGVNLSLAVRRVMANVAGKPDLIARIERQVAEAKIGRATHMRGFIGTKPGSEKRAANG